MLGLRQNLNRSPANAVTPSERVLVDAENGRPLSQVMRLATESYQNSITPVKGLLRRSCPAAILLAVTLVVVNAVECFAGRAFAHVGQEFCEIVQPIIGHSDPPAAISRVFPDVGIVAPSLHSCPNAVERVVATSICSSVLGASLNSALAFQASATFCTAIFQAGKYANPSVTAFAFDLEHPVRSSPWVTLPFHLTNNCQPSKNSSVFNFGFSSHNL